MSVECGQNHFLISFMSFLDDSLSALLAGTTNHLAVKGGAKATEKNVALSSPLSLQRFNGSLLRQHQ